MTENKLSEQKQELLMQLKKIEYLYLDLDNTLIYANPDGIHLQNVTKATLNALKRTLKNSVMRNIKTADDIDQVRHQLGIPSDEFWKTFNNLDNPIERHQHTTVYDDVDALSNLPRPIVMHVVTHAPIEFATLAIQRLNQQGVHISSMKSIHHFKDPQSITKPNPHVVINLAQEHGYIGTDTTQWINHFQQAAIIGDSLKEIQLAHELNAVGIHLNRSGIPSDFSIMKPYLMFTNLYDFVKTL